MSSNPPALPPKMRKQDSSQSYASVTFGSTEEDGHTEKRKRKNIRYRRDTSERTQPHTEDIAQNFENELSLDENAYSTINDSECTDPNNLDNMYLTAVPWEQLLSKDIETPPRNGPFSKTLLVFVIASVICAIVFGLISGFTPEDPFITAQLGKTQDLLVRQETQIKDLQFLLEERNGIIAQLVKESAQLKADIHFITQSLMSQRLVSKRRQES